VRLRRGADQLEAVVEVGVADQLTTHHRHHGPDSQPPTGGSRHEACFVGPEAVHRIELLGPVKATNDSQCAQNEQNPLKTATVGRTEGAYIGVVETITPVGVWVAQGHHPHLVITRQPAYQVVESGDAPVILGGAEAGRDQAQFHGVRSPTKIQLSSCDQAFRCRRISHRQRIEAASHAGDER